MACPYFLPRRRIADLGGVPGWKMPLGGTFSGECRAREGEATVPSEDRLRDSCNVGYACAHCDRFPSTSPYDIIRFLIVEDQGTRALLTYTYEKDHHPAGRGQVEVPVEHPGLLESQAMSYWSSYKERRCRVAR